MHEELVAGLDKQANPLTISRPVRALADLPGPRGWPVLGNAPQIDVTRLHMQRRVANRWTRSAI